MTPSEGSPLHGLGGGDKALYPHLWSLWDMLKTYAKTLGNFWMIAKINADTLERGGDGAVSAKWKEVLEEKLSAMGPAYKEVEMNSVPPQVDRILEGLATGMKYKALGTELRDLYRRIADEIGSRHFLFVPGSLVQFYQEPRNGWGDVPERFRSAVFDIDEAGKCLALGRHTACVAHLMRVLEVGLQCLAEKFRVPYANESWSKVINKITSHINKIEAQKRKPKGWKTDRQFYAEAASEFTVFKDAWRNYAMHVHEKYGEEEARTIYTAVQTFMRQLSKRLSEKV
jgi:hypothetical protein